MFNVKLESFDAAAKPKIIREVKAMVPNLTLIEVSHRNASRTPFLLLLHLFPSSSSVSLPITPVLFVRFSLLMQLIPPIGEEIRRVATKSSQGERRQGGRREAQKDVHGPRCHCCAGVDDCRLMCVVLCARSTRALDIVGIGPMS